MAVQACDGVLVLCNCQQIPEQIDLKETCCFRNASPELTGFMAYGPVGRQGIVMRGCGSLELGVREIERAWGPFIICKGIPSGTCFLQPSLVAWFASLADAFT